MRSLIPLMFHYVRNSDNSLPHSRHYEMSAFKNLIRYFQLSGYSLKTFTEYAEEPDDQTGSCVLTFDDGLADHYNVAAYLHSQGIRATFYLISLPYLESLVAPVHLTQLCVARYGNDILRLFSDYCQYNSIVIPEMDEVRVQKFRGIYNAYDTPSESALFKRIFNFYNISPYIESVLRGFSSCLGLPISVSDYYLTIDQIIDIHRMGHEIGCHGHSHRPLSLLTEEEVHAELSKSKHFFENAIKSKLCSFCYPYGTESSFSLESIRILKGMGFKNACTAEHHSLLRGVLDDRMYQIPRLDIASLSRFI